MRDAVVLLHHAVDPVHLADHIRGDDIGRPPVGMDNPGFGHHDDIICVFGRDVQVVADHDDELVHDLGDPSEHLGHVDLMLHVEIRCGFVQETEAMILDEPTANLDVRHQVYVAQLLREIADKGGKIIIMICHDLNIAARYSSEVIVMSYPGIIERVGTPEEVFDSDLIRRVYGIDCEIVTFEGKPNVMLKSDFVDGDIYD